jgi:hypothetical protein
MIVFFLSRPGIGVPAREAIGRRWNVAFIYNIAGIGR